jgi:hypothetical protein
MKAGAILLLLALAAAMPVSSLALAAGQSVSHYTCSGSIRSESIFEPGSAATTQKTYQLTVNRDASYVKRDPALAAGCLTQQIEICRCELEPEQIRCQSLGLNRNGQEVSADFTLNLETAVMQMVARQSDPQSGMLVEIQGTLQCRLSPQNP